MSQFNTPVVEFLGICPARLDEYPGNPVVGHLTFRMNPDESYHPTNISITREQLKRLRNDINSLLHEPNSWLYDAEDSACFNVILEDVE